MTGEKLAPPKGPLPARCTTQEAIALFDTLDPVDLGFMIGRWQGAEICTGHPMEGLLTVTGWHGKRHHGV